MGESSFQVDPRQSEAFQQEKEEKIKQQQEAIANVDQYAKTQEWPKTDTIMVKMMLGLIPSPTPKSEIRRKK